MSIQRRALVTLRKATLADVQGIYKLLGSFAKRKMLLPRSLSYIYDNVRDYVVATNRRKKVVGCCALHIVWEDLAELKSLAVQKEYQKHQIGTALITHCIGEAIALGARRVFALTFSPDFFKRNGFKLTSKNNLPAKVWRECIECHMFPDCNEIAVVKEIK